jgi:NAD(P)-dependent dehydrogenase (short-subunit alcohol dehydrogenase family)
MTQKQSSVWFITGCSTGFGRELAKTVVDRGFRAVVTARDPKQVTDIVAGHEDHALAMRLDVTDPAQAAESVHRAEGHFGGIDVLVNNAGIGYFGAVEESDEADIRRMFEIDFFGLARMPRAVLPGMRKRRSGHIVNIASIAGLAAYPSLGYYCAAKFAVEGLSEVLAEKVGPLGIKVTLVEPSAFRTDWAGRSANEARTEIADYAATAGAVRRELREMSGKQPGDPVRAASAIIQAVEAPNSPLHLLLGKEALRLAREKLDALRRDFDAWEKVAVGADFPADEPTKVVRRDPAWHKASAAEQSRPTKANRSLAAQ